MELPWLLTNLFLDKVQGSALTLGNFAILCYNCITQSGGVLGFDRRRFALTAVRRSRLRKNVTVL